MKLKKIAGVLTWTVLPIIAGLVVLTLVIVWLSDAFSEKIEPGSAPVEARKLSGEPIDKVHPVFKTYVEESVGRVRAARRTIVAPKIMATVKKVNVTDGQQVDKDQILVQLESKELVARLKQAEQALVGTMASEKRGETEFKRAQDLQRKQPGIISPEAFDARRERLNVAMADRRRAEQAVAEANVMLSYTTIRAPEPGRVVEPLIKTGDTVGPGRPLLVIYDPTSLRLEAPVRETLAVDLKEGQELGIYIDALQQEFKGTIDKKVPQATAASRSFLVKVTLPQSDRLYEGMTGKLKVPAGTRRHLCLSTAAVYVIGQLEYVDAVLPDDTLERRLIKTGRRGLPGKIEVLSGLEAGDRVMLRKIKTEGKKTQRQ